MKKISRRSFVNTFGRGLGASALLTTLPSFLADAELSGTRYEGRKLNVALCGLGQYAEYLAEGIAKSPYCQLSGIVTGTPSKVEKWQKRYQIADANVYNYGNFDKIAHNKDIDLVYVVTPNALHKDLVIRTAQAGKHVITEKPMATSAGDCQQMIDACKAANVQLAVGYRLHFEPTHLELKRLGQQKVYGQIRYIEAALGYKTYDLLHPMESRAEATDWRLNKKLSGGGPLMDLGIYCIQAARYVLGEEPTSVTAQFGYVNDKIRFSETEESISWQLTFPSGAVANCNTSCGFNVDRFYASADEGSFELSPALSYGPFEGKTSDGKILKFPVINQQQKQMDEICKVLLSGAKLPSHISGAEGLKDLKIMEAVYRAAKSGESVKIG